MTLGHGGRAAAAVLVAAGVAAAPGARAQAAPPHLVPERVAAALRSLDFVPTALEWVDSGRVAMVDAAGHQIVFAALRTGEVRRIGRAGGGPGEFRTPSFLLTSASGGFVVDDIAARRLSEFDSSQKFVRSITSPGATLYVVGRSADRVRLLWINFAPDGGGPIVSDVDLSGGSAVERFRPFARDSSIVAPGPGSMGPNPFVAAARGPNGELVLGSGDTYRLVTFDSTGRPVRRFGRPDLPRQFRTADEVAAVIGSMRRSPVARRASPEIVTDMEKNLRERPKPHILGGMAVDETGRVWVATSRGGARTELDVFDAAGRLLGTVTVPDRVRSIAVRLPLLAVLAERQGGDDDGAVGLDVYRVR